MSFTKKRQEQIKHYILEKIDSGQNSFVKSASEAFSVSANTIYRYLREMQEKNEIRKENGKYLLNGTQYVRILSRAKNELTSEDKIYSELIQAYLADLPDNVQRIWEYSFMEMMNNAIDHSGAEHVGICLLQNVLNTAILIRDDGIGIFRKIKEYYHYPLLEDAIDELFKGKLTTDFAHHSGEGIFFTSRVLDEFAAVSDKRIFSHDNYEDVAGRLNDSAVPRFMETEGGTCIYMKLSNDSRKVLKEVFDMFSDTDGGFTKTEIPLKNIFGAFPVSRSQAKRLYNRLDRFGQVILDFTGVDEIGQAFAHEIFVVFQKQHPEVKIIPKNENQAIRKMINHVLVS